MTVKSMNTIHPWGIALLLVTLVSCRSQVPILSEEFLMGNWEYLGTWKNVELQPDTLNVYFFENDSIISEDTTAYDVVTDSGIWKFTIAKDKIIAAERQQYRMTFSFKNDSTAYFHNPEDDRYLEYIYLYQVRLDQGHAKVHGKFQPQEPYLYQDYSEEESDGTIQVISGDVFHVQWDDGRVSKYRRADSLSS